MAKRPESFQRVAAPLRAVAQRFAFLFLLLASGAILLFGKADPQIFDRARMTVTDAFAPVLDALSRPIATGAAIIDEAQYLINLRAQNSALRAENARLLQWHSAARNLATENQRLRGLLQFIPEDSLRFISARVIADSGGTFVRSMLVNAGRRDGVRSGLPVVVGEGLIGRIVETGNRVSRILLIDDLNSRVPVVVGPDRERAVLAGDNSRLPKLIYLASNAQIQMGARIMTSGQGGVFPPGISVGVVASMDGNGVRAQSFVATSELEYVRIVDYGLAAVLDGGNRADPVEED